MMIGFRFECRAISSGSLEAVRNRTSKKLKKTQLVCQEIVKGKVVLLHGITIYDFLQHHGSKFFAEYFSEGRKMRRSGVSAQPCRDVFGIWHRGTQCNETNI